MKHYAPTIFAAAALLAACGGAGGTSGGAPLPPASTPTAPPAPGTTVARGTLVDDATGMPLAGQRVQLDPWIAYPTPGPTPTPLYTTATDANGRFTVTAPNGTYLLVLGPDAVNTPPPGWSTPAPNATDTPIPGASGWYATVHDRIVLSGGGTGASPVPLLAPTMPPEPLYTPPAAETSGNYRLATLDPLTQAPCILAWNALRESKNLAPAVADEWSTENAYAIAWVGFQPNGAGQMFYAITTGDVVVSGGANCAEDNVGFAWSGVSTQKWVLASQTLWFGGTYFPYTAQHSGHAAAEFPIDPRVSVDPSGLQWP